MHPILPLWFLTSALVPGSGATSSEAQETKPSPEVQRIARKYTAAIGGWSRVKELKTRVIRGTFEYTGVNQRATGQLNMAWKAPNSLVEQLRGPMGTVTRGFDGARAWGSHPQAGVRELARFEIDEILLEGALYQPLGVRHRFGEPVYEGRTTVGGRDAEVVSAARHWGRSDRFYFDVGTGLPVRLDLWEEGPEAIRSGNPEEFYLARYYLDDYRTEGGIAVPFYIRRERPNSTMEFRFTEVRHNVSVPDSVFRAAPVQDAPLRAEIEALHREQVAAHKSQPASVARFYTDDASILGSGGRWIGRDQIERYWGGGPGFGLIPQPDGGKVVAAVAPGSSAADEGLQDGDRIVTLDGISAEQVDPAVMRRAAAKGGPVRVVVRRGDRQLEFSILPHTRQ